MIAEKAADAIFAMSEPVIYINGLGGKRWRRNVPATDKRYGPWLRADYSVLSERAWKTNEPCLYLVSGKKDHVIRYVGISKNRMRDRWRESPAIDFDSGQSIQNQLFHSQCWKHIEAEFEQTGAAEYEVRCITGHALRPLLMALGPPTSDFDALGGDGEGIVSSVERWLCAHQSERLVRWNDSMPGKKRVHKNLL